MIEQTSPDQSTELALSISKALSTDAVQTIAALLHPKMPKRKQKALLAAAKAGKTVGFDIIEMHGKVKVPRYECIIDFTKKEVHVIMKNNKHEYGVHDFKEIG
jgi:cell division inhibitor SulA